MANKTNKEAASPDNQTDQWDALSDLIGTSTYGELVDFQEPFDMFKAMRQHIGENESSAIIRYLVSDQETHRLGTAFLTNWLVAMREELGRNDIGLPEVDFEHVTAEVEWLTPEDRRLDILICLRDTSSKPVAWIGVENKHWAVEQPRQVAHYQEALAAHANGLPSCVLFLTPSGKDPETGKAHFKDCPWLALSYAPLLQAISQVEQVANPEVSAFLASFRNHLATNLHHYDMADTDKNLKHRIHELFQNPEHRKAMLLLEQLRPQGHELVEPVQVKLGWEKFEFEKYPSGGSEVREATWWPSTLEATYEGKPIYVCYMLSSGSPAWNPGTSVQVAVMIWCEGVTDNAAKRIILNMLSTSRPAELGPIDEAWWWHSWAPIWVGGKYELSDLQEADIAGLSDLLKNAFEKTHDWLATNISTLDWQLGE